MDADALVQEVEAALGLVDANSRQILERRPGLAYEAFVFVALGARLVADKKWTWVHPAGALSLSLSDGGDLDVQLRDRSHVCAPSGAKLVPAVTVNGRSETSHQVDLLVVQAGVDAGARWDNTLVAIECKNVVKARSLGTARDLVGLATDLRLGAQYRLWRTRPYNSGILVAAHAITPSAVDLLAHWALEAVEHASPPVGAHWVDIVSDEILARC